MVWVCGLSRARFHLMIRDGLTLYGGVRAAAAREDEHIEASLCISPQTKKWPKVNVSPNKMAPCGAIFRISFAMENTP